MKLGAALPPGQWCTVTLDGDGVQWVLPKSDTEQWRLVELEYERGRYRQRVSGGKWSPWQTARMKGDLVVIDAPFPPEAVG